MVRARPGNHTDGREIAVAVVAQEEELGGLLETARIPADRPAVALTCGGPDKSSRTSAPAHCSRTEATGSSVAGQRDRSSTKVPAGASLTAGHAVGHVVPHLSIAVGAVVAAAVDRDDWAPVLGRGCLERHPFARTARSCRLMERHCGLRRCRR